MRNVLLISYEFPPCRAPGAAVRSAKFAGYLPDFGWRPTVLCRDEGGSAAEAPEPRVIRIGSPTALLGSYQLTAWGWAASLGPRARDLIDRERFDLVYASCPPFPHALTAVALARRAARPLVIDFRDSWSLDPHLTGGLPKRLAKRVLCASVYRAADRRILRNADAFVANTPSMRRAYARTYGLAEQRLHLIPNGFDEADFTETVGPPRRDAPVFLYCGRFADVAGRSPDLILRGSKALIDAGLPLQLRVVGDDSAKLRARVAQLGLGKSVSLCPPLPHAQAIHEMTRADVLVLYQEPGRTAITPVAGKSFEYIRSGRPVLALVAPGDNADLVRAHAGSYALVESGDLAEVVGAMKDLHARWRSGALRRCFSPRGEFLARYARRHLTRRLAVLFDGLVERREEPMAQPQMMSKRFPRTRRTQT
jgi:glycosyltransferase involved in cell wall biosynthesis